MPIEFRCTHCNKLLRTKDDSAGKQAKCPECGTRLTVPTAEAPLPAAEAGIAAHSASDFSQQDFGIDNPYSSPRSSPAPSRRSDAVPGEWIPTRIGLSDVLGQTWRILKANLGISILGFVVLIAVMIPAQLVSRGVYDPLTHVADQTVASGVNAITSLLCGALSLYLQTGLQFMMLKIARGEQAAVGDIFAGGKWFAKIAIASLIFGLLIGLGTLVIIGGIIAVLYLWPFPYVIIERDTSPVESLKLAAKATQGNRLTMFLIFLVTGLCSLPLFFCSLGLGMFLFAPYMLLLMPVAYLTMTGQPTADPLRQ